MTFWILVCFEPKQSSIFWSIQVLDKHMFGFGGLTKNADTADTLKGKKFSYLAQINNTVKIMNLISYKTNTEIQNSVSSW